MLRRINGTTLDPFTRLQQEMDRLFDEVGRRLGESFLVQPVFPAVNVWDSGDTLHVEAELPGVRPDDLEVLTVGNELTIKGRRETFDGQDRTYHRRELGSGEFTRVITLPCDVDAEKVEAELRDGVLTVRLPKAEEARPRQIQVKAG